MTVEDELGINFSKSLGIRFALKKSLRALLRPTSSHRTMGYALEDFSRNLVALHINKRVHSNLQIRVNEKWKREDILAEALRQRLARG